MPLINIYPDYKAYAWLLPLDLSSLRDILECMLAAADARAEKIGQLELYLVDDSAIAKINKEYLGCAGPTNIISFPADVSSSSILILSLDTYARERLLFNQDAKEYLLRLLAHGIGHLLGFEHGPVLDGVSSTCIIAANAL